MGWIDEQIRQRKQYDNELFHDTLLNLAGAISEDKLLKSFSEDRMSTKNAIDEILKYLHVQAIEVPDEISDMNEQLVYVMRTHGIMSREIHLHKGWHKNAVGPMIGTIDGQVTAIIPRKSTGFKYKKEGKWIKITSKQEEQFEKEAISFYPAFPRKQLSIWELLKFAVRCLNVSDFLMVAASMMAVTLVGLLTPKFTSILFSDVIEMESIQMLVAVSIMFICISISSAIFTIMNVLYSAKMTTKMNIYVNAATMMRLLSLPTKFFKGYSPGELSNRVSTVASLSETVINMLLTTSITSVFSLLYVAQIYRYAPSLVVPAISMTLLTVALTIITSYVQMNVSKKKLEYKSKEQGVTYALLSGIVKIKNAGAEKRAFAKWAEVYAKSAKWTYNPPLFLKLNGTINTAITLLGTLVMYYFAVMSEVSVSEYYAFTAAYGMVSAAFMSLASLATSFATIKPTLEMAKPLLETVPEMSDKKEYITKLSGNIELNNVNFRYREDMPVVLDDISIKIKAGQYVAIVGKTGCGKTTLLRLLLGFESPQKGAIYYDRRELNKIDLISLRQKIGVVMQNGKLLQSDIFSNITISAPRATMEDAWEAAELASIKQDIEEMPMGMFTMISEGQGGISGGQKQRLMIARSIVSKPKILFLDEATSALDNVTQKHVSESLDKLKCTRVVIAHRVSTIKHCDRIIVLDKGKIIEDGTYDELLEKKGYFSEIVSRQMH